MDYPSYLIHYGIVGQKWGVRRFQNEDGSLTPEGIKRYSDLLDKSDRSEKDKKKLSKFEDKIDVSGIRNHNARVSDYSSRKERIRANARFDAETEKTRHEYAMNAGDRRQVGKDPMHYVKKYTDESLKTAIKFVNGDQSEDAQKIVQHYMNMSMNGLNNILFEIGDFNSYNEHPTKYNQIDYSYNVKNKKLSQKKWKSDWN